jgi:hypothetical protein
MSSPARSLAVPIEAVIALLSAGSEPRQVKVHKPAVAVTEDDLRAAIQGRHES